MIRFLVIIPLLSCGSRKDFYLGLGQESVDYILMYSVTLDLMGVCETHSEEPK